MEDKNANSRTQYLFFILDKEKYAIKASCVQEIVDFTNITKVPKSNPSIKGVTNIRGDLIAVVDPKTRFNKDSLEIQKRTSFIIINIENSKTNSSVPIALMVDMVVEVEEVLKDNILSAPEFGIKLDSKYIENIINYDDEYITVLDVNEVLNIQELSQVE